MTWILLVLFYGAVKGCREILQKKALTKNSVMEILVFYTLLSFVFVVPQAKDALGMEPKFYLLIAVKSFIIFLAWICSFTALKRLPVSLYGILDMTGVLFATMLGVVFLGESLSVLRVLGLVTVCGGLLLLKFKPRFLRRGGEPDGAEVAKVESAEGGTGESAVATDGEPDVAALAARSAAGVVQGKSEAAAKDVAHPAQTGRHFVPKSQMGIYTAIAVISCLLNAVSGFLDKLFMKDVTTSQLQFWYLLFLCAYYVIYICIRRIKIERSIVKNGWVWLLAVLFVAGDKALFMANGIPESSVSVMTLIKQSSCIITIIGGKLIFKEKDTGYRLFCAAVIIAGIVLGTISA